MIKDILILIFFGLLLLCESILTIGIVWFIILQPLLISVK